VREFGFNKRILNHSVYVGFTELSASKFCLQSCNLKHPIADILHDLQCSVQCVLMNEMSKCVSQSVDVLLQYLLNIVTVSMCRHSSVSSGE
jgi:hypothetical protein